MATKENDDDINPLPEEWVELVKQAMKSNITKEDFKQFLKQAKEKREKGFK